MTETPLRKRDREPEAPPDSMDVWEPKRFHSEETSSFLHLLQVDQSSVDDDKEEDFAPSEELINRVMRSLEEEIAATCSASYPSSDSGDNYATPDISSGHERQTLDSDFGADLFYLLEASDDELGIPASPILCLTDEVCQYSKETSESLRDNPDLESLGENWHLEDDFEICQQFVLYDNAWDETQVENYMNRDFVSQAMLFDAYFFADSRVETPGGM